MLRLPFGWKFSPALCQRTLAFFTKHLSGDRVLILHYLDDFMVVGPGFARVEEVTRALVDILIKENFIVSGKSTLAPTKHLRWLGKMFDFDLGTIENLDQGVAGGLVKWLKLATQKCTRKRVRSAVGKLRWLGRPHTNFSPFLAGTIAHILWGPKYLNRTPMAILRGLACTLAFALVGWSSRVPRHPVCWSWDEVIFVDGARQRRNFAWG